MYLLTLREAAIIICPNSGEPFSNGNSDEELKTPAHSQTRIS